MSRRRRVLPVISSSIALAAREVNTVGRSSIGARFSGSDSRQSHKNDSGRSKVNMGNITFKSWRASERDEEPVAVSSASIGSHDRKERQLHAKPANALIRTCAYINGESTSGSNSINDLCTTKTAPLSSASLAKATSCAEMSQSSIDNVAAAPGFIDQRVDDSTTTPSESCTSSNTSIKDKTRQQKSCPVTCSCTICQHDVRDLPVEVGDSTDKGSCSSAAPDQVILCSSPYCKARKHHVSAFLNVSI